MLSPASRAHILELRAHKSFGRGSQHRSIPHLGRGEGVAQGEPGAPGTARGTRGIAENQELRQPGEKEKEREVGAGKFSAAPRPGAPHHRRGPSPAAGRPTPAGRGPARRPPPAPPSPAPAPRRALPSMPPAPPPLPRPPPCCGDEEAPPPARAALRPRFASVRLHPSRPLPALRVSTGGAAAPRPCPARRWPEGEAGDGGRLCPCCPQGCRQRFARPPPPSGLLWRGSRWFLPSAPAGRGLAARERRPGGIQMGIIPLRPLTAACSPVTLQQGEGDGFSVRQRLRSGVPRAQSCARTPRRD